MEWILPVIVVVVIVALIVHKLGQPMAPHAKEHMSKDGPPAVPPERAALGVRAVLYRQWSYQRSRYEWAVVDAAFRPSGDLIAARFGNGIGFWDAEDGTQSTLLIRDASRSATDPVLAFAWSGDGERIAFSKDTADRTELYLSSLADGRRLARAKFRPRNVNFVRFFPDDNLILWKTRTTLGTWNPETNEVREWEPDREPNGIEIVHHSSGRLALLSRDGRGVYTWQDPDTHEVIQEIETDLDEMWIGLLGDGSYALAETHSEMRVRELATGELVATIGQPKASIACSWTDRHLRRLVLGTVDGRLILWRPLEDRVDADLRIVEEGGVDHLAGSEGGALVCIAGHSPGHVEVYDLAMIENIGRSKKDVD